MKKKSRSIAFGWIAIFTLVLFAVANTGICETKSAVGQSKDVAVKTDTSFFGKIVQLLKKPFETTSEEALIEEIALQFPKHLVTRADVYLKTQFGKEGIDAQKLIREYLKSFSKGDYPLARAYLFEFRDRISVLDLENWSILDKGAGKAYKSTALKTTVNKKFCPQLNALIPIGLNLFDPLCKGGKSEFYKAFVENKAEGIACAQFYPVTGFGIPIFNIYTNRYNIHDIKCNAARPKSNCWSILEYLYANFTKPENITCERTLDESADFGFVDVAPGFVIEDGQAKIYRRVWRGIKIDVTRKKYYTDPSGGSNSWGSQAERTMRNCTELQSPEALNNSLSAATGFVNKCDDSGIPPGESVTGSGGVGDYLGGGDGCQSAVVPGSAGGGGSACANDPFDLDSYNIIPSLGDALCQRTEPSAEDTTKEAKVTTEDQTADLTEATTDAHEAVEGAKKSDPNNTKEYEALQEAIKTSTVVVDPEDGNAKVVMFGPEGTAHISPGKAVSYNDSNGDPKGTTIYSSKENLTRVVIDAAREITTRGGKKIGEEGGTCSAMSGQVGSSDCIGVGDSSFYCGGPGSLGNVGCLLAAERLGGDPAGPTYFDRGGSPAYSGKDSYMGGYMGGWVPGKQTTPSRGTCDTEGRETAVSGCMAGGSIPGMGPGPIASERGTGAGKKGYVGPDQYLMGGCLNACYDSNLCLPVNLNMRKCWDKECVGPEDKFIKYAPGVPGQQLSMTEAKGHLQSYYQRTSLQKSVSPKVNIRTIREQKAGTQNLPRVGAPKADIQTVH